MTALPQLVAAFHSLVGLAAVFVAAAAFVSPDAFGIGAPGHIKTQSLIEMGLGTIIGAITFTGSIVAFAKLQGLVSGAPLVFRGQHPLNALLGIALVVLLVWFAMRGHPITFIAADRAVAGAGLPAHPADRRRRHAGRGVDAQLLFGMGGGRHRLHARQHRADRDRRAGRLVGRDPELHHVQGHEPLDLQRDPGRLRHRQLGGGRGARQDRQAGQGGLGRGRAPS